jgi:hypothetical protein
MAGRLQNHDRAIYVHDRHARYGTEVNAKRVQLRRNHVAVLIRLSLYIAPQISGQVVAAVKEEPTDEGGNALVSGYRLFVVALAPLERLCKVHGRLVRFALDIQLVDAALRDH